MKPLAPSVLQALLPSDLARVLLPVLCGLSLALCTAALAPATLRGQQPSSPAEHTAPETLAPAPKPSSPPPATHRFWDKENDWLFAGVAASRALDFNSTLNFRRRGRNEILLTNDLVDDHPAFAAVEAGATGLSIGVSYLFHHYGHHKLERWTSVVHMSAATVGAVRNYSLKTAHAVTPATVTPATDLAHP
jgi:hypothetical protein